MSSVGAQDVRSVYHLHRIFEAVLNGNVGRLRAALRHLHRDDVVAPCCHQAHFPVRSLNQRGHLRRMTLDQITTVFSCLSSAVTRDRAFGAYMALRNLHLIEPELNRSNATDPTALSGQSPCRALVPVYQSTPLHLAAVLGLKSVVRMLLSNGSKHGLGERDSLGHVPLHAAIAGRNIDVVKMVLARTMRINLRARLDIINEAMDLAVKIGEVDIVDTLTKRCRRLVNWNKISIFPAIRSVNFPLVKVLAEGGTVLQPNGDGFALETSALHLAVHNYRNNTLEELRIVCCLLHNGADPNRLCFHNGVTGTALHFALKSRQGRYGNLHNNPVPDIVHALLQWGADPNLPNSSLDPPLFWLKPGPTHCTISLQLLLDHGADPTRTDINGDTYLTCRAFCSSSCATYEEHAVQFARMLLDQGAPLDAHGRRGLTALHRAIKKPKLFWYLLCRGANPELVSQSGRNVLTHLLESKYTSKHLEEVCITLLMCVKGGVSFARPEAGSCSRILSCVDAQAQRRHCRDTYISKVQTVMLRMLFEIGYLSANDQLAYFKQKLATNFPGGMEADISDLCHGPPSLLCLCRRAVFDHLAHHGTHREEVISTQLGIPRLVQKYLCFSDLIKMVADTFNWTEEKVLSYFPPHHIVFEKHSRRQSYQRCLSETYQRCKNTLGDISML